MASWFSLVQQAVIRQAVTREIAIPVPKKYCLFFRHLKECRKNASKCWLSINARTPPNAGSRSMKKRLEERRKDPD
jgi:hypothetical protein